VSSWTPGARVGAYVLGERLGVGAMGSVWSARHQTTGAERALKHLTRADPELRERFAREGEALGRLQQPNVLRVHESFELGADLVLVTELARGDLSQRLKGGSLGEEESVRVCVALAAALSEAHQAGVLHRDLKPANVLFGDDGRPLLADFGIARLQDRASLTESGGVLGTPAYISPEAADGRRSDERSDVYGLGAILYHCLSGRPPFAKGSPIATLTAVVQTPPEPLPEVSRALGETCLRALAKDPDERFQSAAEFAQALVAPEPSATDGRGAWPLLLAAALALLLLGVVLGWLILAPGAESAPTPTPSASRLASPTKSEVRPPSPTPRRALANRPRGRSFRVISRPGERVQAVWQDDQRFVVLTRKTLQLYRCFEREVIAGDPIRRPGHGELHVFHCVEGGVLLGGELTPLCYVTFKPPGVSPLDERTEQALVAEVLPPAQRKGRIWIGGGKRCKAVDLQTRQIVANAPSPFKDWKSWRLRALASQGPNRPLGFYRKNDKTQEAFVSWNPEGPPVVQTAIGVAGRSATYVGGLLWVGTTNRGVIPFGPDLVPRLPPTEFAALKIGRLGAIVVTRDERVFALAETPAELFEFSPRGGAPIRSLWKGRGTQRGWALSLSPDERHVLVSAHGSLDDPGEIFLVSLRE